MRRLKTTYFLSIGTLLVGTTLLPADELRPDFVMLSEPKVEHVTVDEGLPPKILDIWRDALARPESAYARSAAITVRQAHQRGFSEVKSLVPELRKLLTDQNTKEAVRIAAAQALIELDVRDAADELLAAALKSGTQFRQLVEPVLADWQNQPVREIWRERLERQSTHRRELALACAGSGAVRDEQALPALLAIVAAPTRPRDIRLSAARAAAEIADSGLEDAARALWQHEPASIIDRVCAVTLLKRHASPEAQTLLLEMFRDPLGPVAASAIESLLDIDPALVLDLVPQAGKHRDLKVRRAAVESLVKLVTPERIPLLAVHLDDPNPGLRIYVRNTLIEFARQDELQAAVHESTLQLLDGDNWRGQEQACLIVGALDYEDAAERLVDLLQSPRTEVMINSAWALKKIAVKEVLPAMLVQAERQHREPQSEALTAVDRQVAQLLEGMAIMDYRPAIPLMRRHVPKELTHRRLSRGAAVWGLSHLFADTGNKELAAQFLERMRDEGTMIEEPEIDIVRRMSAIALGKMKAAEHLKIMKTYVGENVGSNPLELSIAWAIQEISGEVLPKATLDPYEVYGWRISPIPPKK